MNTLTAAWLFAGFINALALIAYLATRGNHTNTCGLLDSTAVQ